MEHESIRISIQQRGLGFGGRGSHLVIPAIAGPLFSTLLVLNRVYFRFRLVRKVGTDDVLIIVSLVSTNASSYGALLTSQTDIFMGFGSCRYYW